MNSVVSIYMPVTLEVARSVEAEGIGGLATSSVDTFFPVFDRFLAINQARALARSSSEGAGAVLSMAIKQEAVSTWVAPWQTETEMAEGLVLPLESLAEFEGDLIGSVELVGRYSA